MKVGRGLVLGQFQEGSFRQAETLVKGIGNRSVDGMRPECVGDGCSKANEELKVIRAGCVDHFGSEIRS